MGNRMIGVEADGFLLWPVFCLLVSFRFGIFVAGILLLLLSFGCWCCCWCFWVLVLLLFWAVFLLMLSWAAVSGAGGVFCDRAFRAVLVLFRRCSGGVPVVVWLVKKTSTGGIVSYRPFSLWNFPHRFTRLLIAQTHLCLYPIVMTDHFQPPSSSSIFTAIVS